MNIQELLNNITPDIYENLKLAVEIGKWPNGVALTADQRELCMQAVIAYEKANLKEENRTAYIPPKKHQHCGSEKGSIADDEEKPLKFTH